MVEIYLSRNKTNYHFNKSGDLIRSRDGKDENWGKAFYVSERSLEDLLREYQISGKKREPINGEIGKRFLEELRNEEMEINKRGGRFVTLVENGEPGFCKLNYSGNIIQKTSTDFSDDTGTQIPIDT